MPIRLPRSMNVMATLPTRAVVADQNWGVYDGFAYDVLDDSLVNHDGIAKNVNSNLAFGRVVCDDGFTLSDLKTLPFGCTLPITNDGRDSLPLLVGVTGTFHSRPWKGQAPEDVRFLIMQQFLLGTTDKKWFMTAQIPFDGHQFIDSTNTSTNTYKFDSVMTVVPTLPESHWIPTGLFGVFASFYNTTSADYKYKYFQADFGITVAYKNRAVFNPEMF